MEALPAVLQEFSSNHCGDFHEKDRSAYPYRRLRPGFRQQLCC
jgi:hypothetical protein